MAVALLPGILAMLVLVALSGAADLAGLLAVCVTAGDYLGRLSSVYGIEEDSTIVAILLAIHDIAVSLA